MLYGLFIGTYTRPQGAKGIYGITLDGETGLFGAAELLAQTRDPSYLVLSRDKTRMYAVDEQEARGGVNSFELIGGNWQFTGHADSRGGAPCHLALSPDESELAIANYTDGTVAICELKDGALTGKSAAFEGHGGSHCHKNQPCAHAHQCNFVNGKLLVNDLGADEIRVFQKADGEWRESEPLMYLPGGAGPRHLVIGNDGSLYVLGELDSRLHVYLRSGEKYRHAADIPLTPSDRDGTLRPGQNNSDAGAIKLSADGKRIICTTRQDNRVCVLDIAENGLPVFVASFDCGGNNPRDAEFVGEYIVCACQSGGGLTCHRLHADGTTEYIDSADIAMPVCVLNVGERN